MNWAQQHAAIFGHRTADWTETYKIWHRLWAAQGYTMEEMIQAVVTVARRVTLPNYPREHFGALCETLLAARQDLIRKPPINPDDKGTCCTCGDTANVIVPHFRNYNSDGHWMRNIPPHQGYDVAVICDRCQLGARRNMRGMRLSEYEKNFPQWKREVAKYREILKSRTIAYTHHAPPMASLVRQVLAKHS